MARPVKCAFGLAIFALLASCATTSTIETNKNAAYTGLLSKVFIVVDVGDWKYSYNASSDVQKPQWKEVLFGEYLATTLEKKLQERGISTKSTRVTELELSGDQTTKEMSDFGADRAMFIQLSHGSTYDNKTLVKGIFDVSILDTSDMSVEHYPMIWRAKVTAEGGAGYSRQLDVDPGKVIESIMTGLQTDGLIVPLPKAD